MSAKASPRLSSSRAAAALVGMRFRNWKSSIAASSSLGRNTDRRSVRSGGIGALTVWAWASAGHSLAPASTMTLLCEAKPLYLWTDRLLGLLAAFFRLVAKVVCGAHGADNSRRAASVGGLVIQRHMLGQSPPGQRLAGGFQGKIRAPLEEKCPAWGKPSGAQRFCR